MNNDAASKSTDASNSGDPDLQSILRYRETGQQRYLADIYQRNRAPLQKRMGHNFHNAPVDPEEVTHIALTKAFKRLDTFKGESKFSTWLYRIATNAAYDLIREHQRTRDRDITLDDEDIVTLDANQYLADYTYDPSNRDTDAVLADALRGLSERQRTILLETARGIDAEELSERLGVSKGTIKSALHRGRDAITRNITAEPEDMHPDPSFYFSKLGTDDELRQAAKRLDTRHQDTLRIATTSDNYTQAAKAMNTTPHQARVRVLKTVDALTPLVLGPEQTGAALTPELLDPLERLHLQLGKDAPLPPAEYNAQQQLDVSQEDAPTL